MLSCGNQKVFGKDVEHRLADLEYTRGEGQYTLVNYTSIL